jgi:ATP-dependent protease ClpP protease subunit
MSYTANITGAINGNHTHIIRDAISAMIADPSLELEIHIESDGGDPDVAKHIFDLLADYRARTTAIVNGKCMSSAVLIFLAADTRIAGENADFMIHPTSWTLWGMYSFLKTYKSMNGHGDLTLTLSEVYTVQAQLNTAVRRLTEIEDYTDEILASRARLTKKQFSLRRSVNTDQHFTAEESLQLGISTKII